MRVSLLYNIDFTHIFTYNENYHSFHQFQLFFIMFIATDVNSKLVNCVNYQVTIRRKVTVPHRPSEPLEHIWNGNLLEGNYNFAN